MGGLLLLVILLPLAVVVIDMELPGFICDLEDALRGRKTDEDMQDLLRQEGR